MAEKCGGWMRTVFEFVIFLLLAIWVYGGEQEEKETIFAHAGRNGDSDEEA